MNMFIQVRDSGKVASVLMEGVYVVCVSVKKMKGNVFQVYVSAVMPGES